MQYFYIQAPSSYPVHVVMQKIGTTDVTLDLQYSSNGTSWTTWSNYSGLTLTISEGTKRYFRGNNLRFATSGGYWNFKLKGDTKIQGIKLGGNIVSLLNRDMSPVSLSSQTSTYCFYGLFYSWPSGDYINKNDRISSVSNDLFSGITSLNQYCFYKMFYRCTSLTTAPTLPWSTLYTGCYNTMFAQCSSLNNVSCLATSTGATSATTSWLQNVASTGTFTKNAATTWSRGASAIPVGWDVIDSSTGTTIDDVFYFEGISNDCTVKLVNSGVTTQFTPSFECSPDKTTWSTFTIGTNYALDRGDKLYIRRTGYDGYGLGVSSTVYYYFQGTGSLRLGGTIKTLYTKYVENTTAPQYAFSHTFYENTAITEVSENLLSGITELSYASFSDTFRSCSNLTNAPKITPTTFGEYCFNRTFMNCTSLTTPPALPKMSLTKGCYYQMFRNTGITTAPTLPAPTLANECYFAMFKDCTGLTTAPVLSAPTLVDKCYQNMFSGCTSLNYIKCLATNLLDSGTTQNWVCDVAPTGTFVKSAAMNDWEIDSNKGVPVGWTLINDGQIDMSIDFKLAGSSIWSPTQTIIEDNVSTSGGSLVFQVRYGHSTTGATYGFVETTPVENYWTVTEIDRDLNPDYDIIAYRLNYDAFRGQSTKAVHLTFFERENDTIITNSGLAVEQAPYEGVTGMTANPTTITGISWESPSYENIYMSYSGVNLDSVVASAISNPDMFEDIDWYDSSNKGRLMVKCDENPETVARTGQVRVQAQSVAHEPMSATITLTQEARPEGDIAVNPQTIHFQQDADGSSDKQSVYVSYTGFTSIGTVTATTDADWIEIEWRDDEVKNELYITPSENVGSSRQTTIIITGTDDYDNIITVYVVVTQEGVNINPIWRDLYYTGATDTFDYIIVNEDTNETIYQGHAYVQPNSTNVKINISKIVQGYLNNEITDGNVLLNALYDDFNSQAVVDFGLYPVTGSTTGERIEKYTYYYDWSYNALDGNYVLTTPINGHATTTMRRMYTNISLEFDGYRNRANDSTLYDLSYCGDYALYYLQRNGGWASFLIEGNTKKTDSYEKYSYNMSFDNTTAEFEESTYHNEITSNWEMHTGWLTDEQADNLAFNLLASNRVFLHDLKKDKIIPVIISNSEAEYKTFKNNGRQMVNYTITLTESQKKQLL